jgi:uncharacterized membrane protein YfhO
LVISDPYYPGWSAFLDGKPAPLLAANYALRGVAVPAGEHTVELRYRSVPLQAGLAASALALAALLAWTLRGGRVRHG